jgi:hypothetical protein
MLLFILLLMLWIKSKLLPPTLLLLTLTLVFQTLLAVSAVDSVPCDVGFPSVVASLLWLANPAVGDVTTLVNIPSLNVVPTGSFVPVP